MKKEVDKLQYLQQIRAAPNRIPRPQHGESSSSRYPRATRASGLCFKCGQAGHFQRNCPNRNQQPHQLDCMVQSQELYSAQAKSSLKRQNRGTAGATCLHAKVGKHTCDCLLDTGSEVTIIPASVVEDEVVKPSNHKLTAANGTEITVLGKVTLPISVGDYSGTVSGLVSEHVGEVTLGVDWMEDNAITWEFHRSKINIGQKCYGLKRHSNVGSWCRRVFLQTDVVIPSRSEVDVPTSVVMRRLSDKINVRDVEWGTEPGSVLPGVHTSRTFIPGDRLVNILVRVMNVRSEDVVMKAGARVADLQSVTILGKVPETASRGPEAAALNLADSGERLPQFIQELIDGVHDTLPESTRIRLAGILRFHADVFSESENDLGLTDLVCIA